MSKEINRRMFIGLATGAIAATASGIPESSAKGAIHSGDESLFYKVVIKLCVAINKLQVASRGMFCPKEGSIGYLVVPKSKEYLLNVKNEYGFSIRSFCKGCWPNMHIVPPSEIDLVYENGEWVSNYFADDTWAIIDRVRYGTVTHGEDSFVTFKV